MSGGEKATNYIDWFDLDFVQLGRKHLPAPTHIYISVFENLLVSALLNNPVSSYVSVM